MKNNLLPRLVGLGLISLSAVSAVFITLAWFIGSDKTSEKHLDGELGLRGYFYDGNGSENKRFEIVRPDHFYNLTRLQNLGLFSEKKYFQVGHVFDNVYLDTEDHGKGQIDTDGDGTPDKYISPTNCGKGTVGLACINGNDANGNPRYEYFLDMGVLSNALRILPVGGEGAPFVGDFDGKGMPIRNLKVSGYPEDIGVFGYVSYEGVVKGLVCEDLKIHSLGYTETPADDSTDLYSSSIEPLFDGRTVENVFNSLDDITKYMSLSFFDNNASGTAEDPVEKQLKNYNGLGGTIIGNINSHGTLINGVETTKVAYKTNGNDKIYSTIYNGYFLPTFPDDLTTNPVNPEIHYKWKTSSSLLKKCTISHKEAGLNVSAIESDVNHSLDDAIVIDMDDLRTSSTSATENGFNCGEDRQVDARLSLIAYVDINGFTFSRVIQSYKIEFYSNSKIYDQGGYSMAIFCDYTEKGAAKDKATNYHHGNNIGFLAGHVDGTIMDSYVYKGKFFLNDGEGCAAIKTESETGLVGEIGTNVVNTMNPDFGKDGDLDTGVINFSLIYDKIRDNFEVGNVTMGAGAPNAVNGEEDDYYFNTSTSTLYKKSESVWQSIATSVSSGNDDPDDENGSTGDYYVNTKLANSPVLFKKGTSSWESITNGITKAGIRTNNYISYQKQRKLDASGNGTFNMFKDYLYQFNGEYITNVDSSDASDFDSGLPAGSNRTWHDYTVRNVNGHVPYSFNSVSFLPNNVIEDEKANAILSGEGNPNSLETSGNYGDYFVDITDTSSLSLYKKDENSWLELTSAVIKTGNGNPNSSGVTGDLDDYYADITSTSEIVLYKKGQDTWENLTKPSVERGLGVFKIVTDTADDMSKCVIVSKEKKQKVYLSTAEYVHREYDKTTGWGSVISQPSWGSEAGNIEPLRPTTFPSYSSDSSFKYPFSRDYNYCVEMDLKYNPDMGRRNYLYNTDSEFMTNYLGSILIDKNNGAIEHDNPRFGFMFRSKNDEEFDGLTSYMPIYKPGSMVDYGTNGRHKYYPNRSITFKIENQYGANVSIVANNADVSIYSIDTSSSAAAKEVLTMRSSNVNAEANVDAHRYFEYEPFNNGKTGPEAVPFGIKWEELSPTGYLIYGADAPTAFTSRPVADNEETEDVDESRPCIDDFYFDTINKKLYIFEEVERNEQTVNEWVLRNENVLTGSGNPNSNNLLDSETCGSYYFDTDSHLLYQRGTDGKADMLDGGALYAHIFKLPQGEYAIGTSQQTDANTPANIYFLAVQGQTEGDLGTNYTSAAVGTAITDVDFLLEAPKLSSFNDDALSVALFNFKSQFSLREEAEFTVEIFVDTSDNDKKYLKLSFTTAVAFEFVDHLEMISRSTETKKYYVNTRPYTDSHSTWVL